MADQTRDSKAPLIFALCVVTAIFEGADMISLGQAAPRLGAEFHLRPQQIGWALSASLIGLMLGASVAGRLSDRYGRKRLLVAAMALLGVFSLATVAARDFSSLILIRFLAGAGLGGAFPTLIAIAAESSPAGRRGLGISLVYTGQPIGAAILSLIVASTTTSMGWRGIFIIGGLGPLALAPLLAWLLPESEAFQAARRQLKLEHRSTSSLMEILFGEGRGRTTLLLWVSCLFTLFMVSLMLNWIPSLMIGKGLTRPQAGIAAMALFIGNAFGTLVFGVAIDRANRRMTILIAYGALLVSLIALSRAESVILLTAFSGAVGFFMLGCQLIIYAIAADYYPTLGRGAGVGSMVAVGRLGGISAPIVGGALLGAGFGASAVIATTIPCAILAAIFTVALTLSRPTGVANAARALPG